MDRRFSFSTPTSFCMTVPVSANFASHKHDHRVLNTAYHLSKQEPHRAVILVTKDVNLRMKAKAMGLMAQDYTSDHVRDINSLYSGKRVAESIPVDLIDRLYGQPAEAPPVSADIRPPLIAL